MPRGRVKKRVVESPERVTAQRALRRVPSADSFLKQREPSPEPERKVMDISLEIVKCVAAEQGLKNIPTFALYIQLPPVLARGLYDAFYPAGAKCVSDQSMLDGIDTAINMLLDPRNDSAFVIAYYAIELTYWDALARVRFRNNVMKWKDRFGVTGLDLFGMRVESSGDSNRQLIRYTRGESERVLLLIHLPGIYAHDSVELMIHAESVGLKRYFAERAKLVGH